MMLGWLAIRNRSYINIRTDQKANTGKERRPTGKSTKIPTKKESKRIIHPNTNRERIKARGEMISLALQFLIVEMRHTWMISSQEFERTTKHQLLKGSNRGNRINNSNSAPMANRTSTNNQFDSFTMGVPWSFCFLI